jgi:hypothetical protein
MSLELLAVEWLLYTKRCEVALCERSPRIWTCGQPDALGITQSRYTVEIEIKRSLSDFRADFQKRHRQNRELHLDKQPRQFYYLTPAELRQKIEPIIPDWAGYMIGSHCIEVIKEAPVNRKSARLSVRECLRVPRLINNFNASLMRAVQNWQYRFTEGHWNYHQDYEI